MSEIDVNELPSVEKSTDRPPRERTLSLKAAENFTINKAKFLDNICNFQQKIDKCLDSLETFDEGDQDSIDKTITTAKHVFKLYQSTCARLSALYLSMDTSESQTLNYNLGKTREVYESLFSDSITPFLHPETDKMSQTGSRHSSTKQSSKHGSIHSENGNASMTSEDLRLKASVEFAEANARHLAAKKKLELDKQQSALDMSKAALEKQSADLRAEQLLFETEADLSVKSAALSVLSNNENDMLTPGSQIIDQLPIMTEKDRVNDLFVNAKNSDLNANSEVFTPKNSNPIISSPRYEDKIEKPPFLHEVADPSSFTSQVAANNFVGHLNSENCKEPAYAAFQYIASRNLVSSNIKTFDDAAENYRSWKHSFKNLVNANPWISASEQFDLLITHCGKATVNQLRDIKSIYVDNLTKGLGEAWARLDREYGMPEMVAENLLKKIMDFPVIESQNYRKLLEFSDKLALVKYAKEDNLYPALSYLDDGLGIRSLIKKLPFYLQEKFQTKAFHYGENNSGKFPPFEFFCKFVQQIAMQKNHPLLKIERPQVSNQNRNRQMNKFVAKPIVIQKTEIKRNDESPRGNMFNDKKLPSSVTMTSENTLCLIHKTNHLTSQCRQFLKTPPAERRELLKLNNHCFKCIDSKYHSRNNCPNKDIKCTKCQNIVLPLVTIPLIKLCTLSLSVDSG